MTVNNRFSLCEQKNTIRDESGYTLELDEISFNQIDLKWGNYINPHEKMLTFDPPKPAIVSHFRMADGAHKKEQGISEKEFVIYRVTEDKYDLCIDPTYDKTRSFFELMISDHFFNNLFTEESAFLTRFQQHQAVDVPCFDFTAQMSANMYAIINDMQSTPYSGYLKGLYLEAKSIELFLLQVGQLDRKSLTGQSALKAKDVEALHAVKHEIESNYQQSMSISGLAKKAGINQMKLKNGFKELFNTTVFGYLRDLRMQEAKRLLLDEKMLVNEVSDRIGYQYPHHFSAAFKKKFGLTPKTLRNL